MSGLGASSPSLRGRLFDCPRQTAQLCGWSSSAYRVASNFTGCEVVFIGGVLSEHCNGSYHNEYNFFWYIYPRRGHFNPRTSHMRSSRGKDDTRIPQFLWWAEPLPAEAKRRPSINSSSLSRIFSLYNFLVYSQFTSDLFRIPSCRMLSVFRAAARSLRQSTRFSSTLVESNATGPSTNSGLQAVIASQQTPPVASTSKLPPVLNIPPAEDPLLHYLTSSIMKHGRRSKAARVTSRTLLHLHSFTRSEPLPLLREAILAASPAVKCLSHRHGSKNVHKPVALGEKQRTRFAVQWILEASNKKPGKTLEERLAREIIAVLEGNSKALAKKTELHKFAMVNRYVPTHVSLRCLMPF